jgi:DNA-binding NarL/FixJ family response regulator
VDLTRAVVSRLENGVTDATMTDTLRLLCDELSVDRFSLHSFDYRRVTFRVVASAGSPILEPRTELPIGTSTQLVLPAAGQIFRRSNFGDESFDAALDHLVSDLGFRAGVSVPLFLGSGPIGALAASCAEPNLDCDPLLDVMGSIAPSMALALYTRMSETKCQAAICYDDVIVAQGLSRIAERALGASVRVCSEFEDAIESDRVAAQPTELVICDVVFGGRRLDEFLPEMREHGLSGPVLVIATNPSQQALNLAVRAGVLGFVARNSGPLAIQCALQSVHAGRPHGLDGVDLDDSDGPPIAINLTHQEARVLVLLERGLRFKQIAAEMMIAESTGKGYARNLFNKLGATSRSEAVYLARRYGLLDLLAPTDESLESAGSPATSGLGIGVPV